MNKNFKFMTVALSFVLAFTAMAFGQSSTSSIEGTITDQNGAVVSGATVTVKASGSTAGYSATATSNSDGFFLFGRVPVGTYIFTSTASGFKTSRQEITVSLDKAAVVNSKLEVGGAGVTVEVLGDSSTTLDIGDTVIDSTISKRVFDELPKGTTFGSLLKIAPNVRPEPLGGGFQIDGASGSENTFNIDGQEVTNFRTGVLNANNNLPFELLQEVQIKSTGYEAEYGGATGGVITVATIGGNDNWRGNFGISFAPSKLQGSPRPVLNRFDITTPTGFEYFNPAKDGGTNFFPVGAFSGPIIKEKLWFSLIYAPQIFDTTRTIGYYGSANPANRVATETITYKQHIKQEQAFARVDFQPAQRLRGFASFLYNPQIQEGVLPGLTEGFTRAQSVNFGGSIGTLGGSDLLGRQGGRQNSNSMNVQTTWNPTNSLIFNFRGGRTFLNEKLNSYFLPSATRYICSATNGGAATLVGSGCTSGFQNIGNNFNIAYDVSTRTTFDADASLVGVNAAGRHNFKFGYQLNRLFNTTDQGYKNLGIISLFYGVPISSLGVPNTPTGSTVLNPSGSCATAPPNTPCNLGSGRLQRFGTVGEASSQSHALFAQDNWTVNSRFSLNLGIRIENETVPNFGTAGTQAIKFGWGDKISPRIGGAFDVTGKGKSKIFASYGWFYDRFKYELPRGSFGGDFFRRDFFELLPGRGSASGLVFTGYTLANIRGNNPDPIGGTCPIVGGTGFSVCQFDFRVATNIAGADIFETGAIDPNLKAARQSEYTFGYEQRISSDSLFSARYTHKNVDRAIEDIGVFNAAGSEAYIIGNPGFGLHCSVSAASNVPCAKAERKYDALEARFDKRATNYFINASYTYSRLFGNYSGLASSDEGGRTSPGVNRFFDLPPLGFNADGDPDNGLLATDRPHVFKAYGGYSFNWNKSNINRTTVSSFTTMQSGTPLTTIYNLYGLGTTILNGRGDLGRTEMFTETDFSVNHRYKFGRDARFTLEGFMNITNLFNERNQLTAQTNISNTTITGGSATSALVVGGCPNSTVVTGAVGGCGSEGSVFQTIFNGPGLRTYVNNFLTLRGTSATGRLNDYGLANGFQIQRQVRFGFRLFF